MPITYGIAVDNPLIVVNSGKVDKEYAELLMNEYYTKRTVEVNSNKDLVFTENIIYNVPAIEEFEIQDGKGKLLVEFTRSGDSITYKTFEYEEELESRNKDDEVTFMGKTYKLIDYNSGSRIVLGNKVKDIETTGEFTYEDYKFTIIGRNSNSELLMSVHKGNTRVENVKIFLKDRYTVKDSEISIYYDEYLESGKTPYFFFEIYDSIELKNRENYDSNGEFRVTLDGKRINLDYRSPRTLSKDFKLLNYDIKVSEISNSDSTVFFTVKRNANYILDMKEGTKYLGNNIFAVKIEKSNSDDELYLYKNGKRYEKIVDYQGSVQVIDQDELLSASSDLILIGGPVSNKVTESIQNSLKIKVTNDNPGPKRGVIQKIVNPKNKDSTILVLAGSDREGTKACVLALNQGLYNGQDNIIVELTGDNSVRII
jgi:hypothetical protein